MKLYYHQYGNYLCLWDGVCWASFEGFEKVYYTEEQLLNGGLIYIGKYD